MLNHSRYDHRGRTSSSSPHDSMIDNRRRGVHSKRIQYHSSIQVNRRPRSWCGIRRALCMMMGTTTRAVTATATALSWLFCRIRGRLRVTSLALMRRLHKSSSTRRYARAIAAIGTTTLATAIHMWDRGAVRGWASTLSRWKETEQCAALQLVEKKMG